MARTQRLKYTTSTKAEIYENGQSIRIESQVETEQRDRKLGVPMTRRCPGDRFYVDEGDHHMARANRSAGEQ